MTCRQAVHLRGSVSMTNSRVNSATISFAIHSGTVVLLFLFSRTMTQPTPVQVHKMETLFAPARHLPAPAGGGGERQALPATAGKLPPPVRSIFIPPTVEVATRMPKLAVAMSIEAPPDAVNDFTTLGDPLAHILNGSGGTGGPAGIGNGKGKTVGDGRGPGAGNGDLETGRVYGMRDGVTLPVLIRRVDPEFSEEARKAKYSGVVSIRADVDSTGHARNLRVVKSVGMGLDEKAIEAVSKWLFRPGTKDGKPVSVSAVIEVSFRLL